VCVFFFFKENVVKILSTNQSDLKHDEEVGNVTILFRENEMYRRVLLRNCE